MAEELRVVITAKDGASRVFKEVGAAAGDVGTQAEKAGEKGERGFKRMGDAAQKTKVDTAALGAALTALGAGLAYSSAMAMQQERSMIALNRAFGENADEVIRFSQELDDLSIFSDDDIRAGARYFATLQNNYDLTIDQVKELMSVTSELAAASGTTFEDASSRVTAAIRGEGEAAEFLGLTMNQQSIDRENLTLSMTNQEAAQFRLNALMQQSAPYIGTNNDLLKTGVGTVNNYKDALQDTAAAVGGFLGPAGTMISAVGTLGLGLTGLTTGTNAAKAGLDAVTKSGKAASILGTVLNPWVLGATAAVAAGVALWNNYKEGAEVIATMKDAYLELAAAQQQALMSGDEEGAARLWQLRSQVESVRAESELQYQEMRKNNKYIFDAQYREEAEAKRLNADESERLAESERKLAAAMQDSRIDADALSAAQGDLYWQYVRGQITLDEYLFRMDELSNNTAAYTKATEDATTAQEQLNAALEAGVKSWNDAGTVARLALLSMEEYTGQSRRMTRDANESNRERRKTINVWLEEASVLERMGYASKQNAGLQRQLAEEERRLNEARRTRENTLELAAHENALDGVTGATERLVAARREAFTGFGASVLGVATEEVEDYNEWLDIVTENLNRLFDVAGYGDPLSRWNLSDNATQASILAENINDAATALDTVFRVTVGNTNAIAQQADSVLQWADELIGVAGEYGKIDDLLANGLITQEQYNAAQQSYNSIAQDTASIQEYTLKIQAMQAPLIAEQTADLENQLEVISQWPAEQQLIALGWMDATTAARAMEFQTLAVAAANGELGANGEEAFTAMITGAAQADPVLKALLIDMGLISEGADGTITVNFGSVEGAKSEIALLTDSINVLILTLGGVPPTVSTAIEANTAEAEAAIDRTMQALFMADNQSATMSLLVNDFASGVISATQNALDALNGKVATSTIRTIYETQGLGPGMQYGGVVNEYATGGVVIRAGEVGPEIVSFANGGTAVLPYDGLYSVPAGSYISPAHASASRLESSSSITVNVTGPVYGIDDLTEQVMRVMVPRIENAESARRRQMGVS